MPELTEHLISCGECDATMLLRKSKHGPFYSCSRYPECRGTHGAHADGKPFGKPADKETRAARIRAHEAFDLLWMGPVPPMSRAVAYRWLAKQLGIESGACHFAHFDRETCERAIEIVRTR